MILFVLVDGVGIGERDPGKNPLARGDYLLSHFRDGSGSRLPKGGRVVAADATLGVPGRPQSATGHTALFTGVNASAYLGQHLLGFPNAALRELLLRQNLFLDLERRAKRASFANAYRCAYLDALELPHVHATLPEPPLPVPPRRIRPSASTVTQASVGGPFRTFDHLRGGEALYHDITNAEPRAAGCTLPAVRPAEAAQALLELGRQHDCVVFEYFRTDQMGHARDFHGAERALGTLDAMLRAVVDGLRPGEGLLVTSDHGNLEDLSTRQHTLAPVPVLGFGTAARRVSAIRSILDVHPALLELAGA